MSNSMVKMFVAAIAVYWALSSVAFAQYACSGGAPVPKDPSTSTYNPCPDSTDLELPMPAQLKMIFRRVEVPGSEFWGNTERNMVMGHPDAPIFEAERAVTIAGSFPSADGGHWDVLVGKYEVTVAQYASIVGQGSVDDGLRQLVAKSGGNETYARFLNPTLSENQKRRLLSTPVTSLTLSEFDRFVDMYTEWCYANDACMRAMPRFGDMPGFFRMPTEVEWEYVARGGSEKFTSELPFDSDKVTSFAYISTNIRERNAPTPIGRLEPTNGFYDLFGNVAELAEGRFYTELGQGKPGGAVVRGGDLSTRFLQPGDLRVSMRREVPEYKKKSDGTIVPLHNDRTGLRLAVGSLNVPNDTTFARISSEYDVYRSTARLRSASALSTRASLLQAVRPLDEIDTLVEDLRRGGGDLTSVLNEMSSRTEQARVVLQRTTEDLSYQLARNAMRVAAEAGRSLSLLDQSRKALELVERKLNPSAQDERRKRTLIDRYEYYRQAFEISVKLYETDIRNLATYHEFAQDVLKRLEERADRQFNPRDQAALALAKKHVEEILSGGGDPNQWRKDIEETYRDQTLMFGTPK